MASGGHDLPSDEFIAPKRSRLYASARTTDGGVALEEMNHAVVPDVLGEIDGFERHAPEPTRAFNMSSRRFTFADDVELSVEADPRLVTREQLRTLRTLGFTRTSFGVQDLEPDVQEAINRLQPVELVQEVHANARAAGFREINLDLVYGLLRQTLESFARTLEQVIALAPDRVACFGYAHMPAQREGQLHRDFMGYTTMPGRHLVGVGMSAISDVAGAFAQNQPGLTGWRERVSEGRLPTIRGHGRSDEDRMRHNAILHLLCNPGLPYHAVLGDVNEVLTHFVPSVEDGLARCESATPRLALDPDLGAHPQRPLTPLHRE